MIPGDGIGQEVVPEGLRVLDRLAERSGGTLAFAYESFPVGLRVLPADGQDDGRGWPRPPGRVRRDLLRRGRLAGRAGSRQPLGPAAGDLPGIRPVRLHAAGPAPARDREPASRRHRETIDWVVVRENSEGEYAGIGGRNLAGRGPGAEVATQSALFTEHGCERIIRYAFDLARTRKRRKVTSVTKSNAQQYAMTLWDDIFRPGRGRLSGRRDRAVAGRCDGRALRAAAGVARGRGRLQSLRRHPLRPRQRARGQHGDRRQRQHRSRAAQAEHVRAGPRLGARYRRPGDRQPDRRRSGAPP